MRFDPTAVDDNEFPVLQPGTHRVMVDSIELKPTSAGTGKRLVVRFIGIDGASKGISVMHGFNVDNPNPDAVRISFIELKKFLAAIGITKSVDLETELPRMAANKTLYVQTTLGEYQGKPQANVKGFAPASSQQRQQQAGYTPPSRPQPAADPRDFDTPF